MTDTELVTRAEILSVNKEIAELMLSASQLVIETEDEHQIACEFLQGVKGIEKKIDAQWESLVAPHKRLADREAEKLNPLYDRLKKAEMILKQAIAKYRDEQEKRRKQLEAEEQARRREILEEGIATAKIATETGDVELAQTADELLAIATTPVEIETVAPTPGVQGRKVWAAELENEDGGWGRLLTVANQVLSYCEQSIVPNHPESVSLFKEFHDAVYSAVPAEYSKGFDLVKLKRLITAHKGNFSVPGVTFRQETQIASRAK